MCPNLRNSTKAVFVTIIYTKNTTLSTYRVTHFKLIRYSLWNTSLWLEFNACLDPETDLIFISECLHIFSGKWNTDFLVSGQPCFDYRSSNTVLYTCMHGLKIINQNNIMLLEIPHHLRIYYVFGLVVFTFGLRLWHGEENGDMIMSAVFTLQLLRLNKKIFLLRNIQQSFFFF